MDLNRLCTVGICVILLAPNPGMAQTLNCIAERVAVQQERNLLRKQDLLDNALALCPGDMRIHFEKGFAEERLRNYEQALKHYTIATRIDPSYARAHFGRADVLMILENYQDAIEAYETGLTLAPDNPRARAALSKARSNYTTAAPALLPAYSEQPAANAGEAND